MLTTATTVLVVVDVQGKLAQLMHGREALFAALSKIIRGARALALPILWIEQNPERMGPTIPEVRDLLPDLTPIPKMSFSCAAEPRFMEALRKTGCRQALLAGIEAHVCIAQTAVHLAETGWQVEVASDAVSSRTAENKALGLEKIRVAGGRMTSVEAALFEMLGTATHPAFKEVLKIVK